MDPAAVHASDTARTAKRFKIGLGGRQESMPWPAGRYRQPSAVGSALVAVEHARQSSAPGRPQPHRPRRVSGAERHSPVDGCSRTV